MFSVVVGDLFPVFVSTSLASPRYCERTIRPRDEPSVVTSL
jgi:hypothetical protein